MRRLRSSSTSRKPLLVTSPTRAPASSRIAFDATVVPCMISATSRGATPCSANTDSNPSTMARA